MCKTHVVGCHKVLISEIHVIIWKLGVFIDIFSINNSCYHSVISALTSTGINPAEAKSPNHQADVDCLADRSSIDAVDDPSEHR